MTDDKRPADNEPIAKMVDQPADENDVEGHGLLNEGFQRPPATSRNADKPANHGCRTPGRTHPTRRASR